MAPPLTSIRYPFAIDAGLGRLAVETDYAAHVEQLMRQVLFTSPGERVNRPDFGCGLRRMVFAPNSEVTASLLQVTVFQALTRWLGTLIEVERVEVQAVDEVLEVRIAYVLRARQERRYLNLEVTL
jgi:phage baseplate assembly protein W